MKYTAQDLENFQARNIKPEVIDRQLDHFSQGFDFVNLSQAATPGNGIRQISADQEDGLLEKYSEALQNRRIVKMVPASGSATRMFKDLYHFLDTYTGTDEEFLEFVQNKEPGSMHYFFSKLDELPFYTHLSAAMWHNGKDIEKMLRKHEYKEILKFILGKKGLNYGNTPKGLVDFHIYRDFVRTAFDEHLVEGALYCAQEDGTKLHFTVSEEHLPAFRNRLKKVTKVFEKMFNVRYDVSFSVQEKCTDMVSLDENREILRDSNGEIIFRPGGHGALLHNLNAMDADLVFIKNIDNIIPDRAKCDTVRYKKLLGGTLLEAQEKIAGYLKALENGPDEALLSEIEAYTESVGYRAEDVLPQDKAGRISRLRRILDRPVRVCGMVKNEGEPGGGPFWVKTKDGSSRLMIVESAQINHADNAQETVFQQSTHFNPVDLVCGLKDYQGRKFNLEDFVATDQGFITTKSYMGKDIRVQELPGLWNGAMANWITIFVEVPLTTFTPVKTVFDLFRFEHRNILKR